MSEFVTCVSCGARNSVEAVWCTMCFEPLRKPEVDTDTAATEPEPAAVAVSQSSPAPPKSVESLAVEEPVAQPRSTEGTWTCRTCENVNPITADLCPICGTTIFQTMGAETREITLTQNQGLRLGLVPGLAHGRLGEPVVGFIIAVLVVACLAFGVLFIVSGGAIWGLVVGLVGLVTWAISIFDVNQRIAGAAPILRPRVMTILGGLVILVIMVAGFVAGATAVGSPGS